VKGCGNSRIARSVRVSWMQRELREADLGGGQVLNSQADEFRDGDLVVPASPSSQDDPYGGPEFSKQCADA
jgi:hypothetical protein